MTDTPEFRAVVRRRWHPRDDAAGPDAPVRRNEDQPWEWMCYPTAYDDRYCKDGHAASFPMAYLVAKLHVWIQHSHIND